MKTAMFRKNDFGKLIEHVNFMETTYNYVRAFINVLSIKVEHIKILSIGLPTLRADDTGRPSWNSNIMGVRITVNKMSRRKDLNTIFAGSVYKGHIYNLL